MDIIVFLIILIIVIALSIIVCVREVRKGARWTKAVARIIKNIVDTISGGV